VLLYKLYYTVSKLEYTELGSKNQKQSRKVGVRALNWARLMKSDHKLTGVMPGYAKGEPEDAPRRYDTQLMLRAVVRGREDELLQLKATAVYSMSMNTCSGSS